MKAAAKFLVLGLLLSGLTTARAQLAPVLQQVEKRLQVALVPLILPPIAEHPDAEQTLVMRYRAQKFLVHSHSMMGEWSTNAVEQIGPNYRGFVLRVYLQRLGEVNQAITPQTLQEPYWRTYLDVTPIAGTTSQIYWALSYGSRTDETLLARIKKTLQDMAHPHPGLNLTPGGSLFIPPGHR